MSGYLPEIPDIPEVPEVGTPGFDQFTDQPEAALELAGVELPPEMPTLPDVDFC